MPPLIESESGSVSGMVDVIDIARVLVRTPSPNPGGDEREMANQVIQIATQLGLPRPQVFSCDVRRPNVLFTIDFGPGGRHLALCGHLDTKPVGDARWESDPFEAVVEGDRLIGLGSADMKAGLSAMLVAAARASAFGVTQGRLSLLFTADEEAGARFGARFLAESGLVAADAIVIGEPGGIDSDFDTLHLVSRGSARLRIRAVGRQGHSSLSDEGGVDPATRNAGVAAARAVCSVSDATTLAVPPNLHGLQGWRATVNTGLLYTGGVGFGVLPGMMAVDTEVRTLPGMERDSLLAVVTASVARAQDGMEPQLSVSFDDPPLDWLAPTMVDPTSAIAVTARDACIAVLDTTPAWSVFPGTTDASWLGGELGVPTLPALGPGLLRRAHGPDEWVSVSAIRKTVDLYADLIRRFCVVEG